MYAQYWLSEWMNENHQCRHRDRAGVSLLARVMWLPNISTYHGSGVRYEERRIMKQRNIEFCAIFSWRLRDPDLVTTAQRWRAASILLTDSMFRIFCFPTCGMWRTGLWLLASPLRPATLANADMTWNKLNLLFLFTFFDFRNILPKNIKFQVAQKSCVLTWWMFRVCWYDPAGSALTMWWPQSSICALLIIADNSL